jgi:hypothetical protein
MKLVLLILCALTSVSELFVHIFDKNGDKWKNSLQKGKKNNAALF